MSTTPRRAALAVPLLLVGAALSGCGVSDETPVRPGVAARVAGTEITVDDVDDKLVGTCDYLDTAGGTALPRVTVRRLLLEVLVRQAAAERLVDELGAELPATYGQAVAEINQQYTDVPDDQAEALRAGDLASTYVAAATTAIGNTLLREETGSEPGNPEVISSRGAEALDEWIASHPVDVNPVFGLRFQDGTLVADDGLSVPASSTATEAQDVLGLDLRSEGQQALGAALTEATAALPADQVCGPTAAETGTEVGTDGGVVTGEQAPAAG